MTELEYFIKITIVIAFAGMFAVLFAGAAMYKHATPDEDGEPDYEIDDKTPKSE